MWIEVGYDLEQFITDGFAGETSRQYMAPEFRPRRVRTRAARRPLAHRRPHRTGTQRHAARGVPAEADRAPNVGSGGNVIFALFVLFIVLNAIARTRRRRRFGGWGTRRMERLEQRSRTVRWRLGGFGGGGGGFRRRLRRLWRRTQRRRRRRSGLVNLAMQNAKCKCQEQSAKSDDDSTDSFGMFVVLLARSGASCLQGAPTTRSSARKRAIKAQWAQVENQLQRRNDLIPNLVETTKGIAQQEKDVFGQIADSRAKMAGATTPDETIQAANEQSAALGSPARRRRELSAAAIERKLQPADGRALGHGEPDRRRAHALQRAGAGLQHSRDGSSPSNITASIFGFKEYPLFNAPPAAEQVPKVNFGKGTN